MRICLDSNCLRDRLLVDKALLDAKAANGHVLIPDIVLAEMIKSSDWRSTMKSSLRHLRGNAENILVADSVGAMIRRECNTQRPCLDACSLDLTNRFRYFINEIDSNETAVLNELESRVLSSRYDLETRLQDASQLRVENLNALRVWTDIISTQPGNLLQRVRQQDPTAIPEILRLNFIAELFQGSLVSLGFNEQYAHSATAFDSVARRNFLTSIGSLLRWIGKGGLDSRTDQQLRNDHIDLDVVVTGTYCDENRAKDKIVRELDAILRPVCLSL